MSLAAFQSVMTELVTSAAFRASVRARGEAALTDYSLTEKERRRAIRLAADDGVRVTGTLVESFRLAKIVKLAPLTRTLLGEARLAEEARAFWQVHPPRSFYAVDEVIAFCDYLEGRLRDGMWVPYLEDVLALERTMLELRGPHVPGGAVTRLLQFRHDPVAVLGPLAAGRIPGPVAAVDCALLVTVREDGSTTWTRAVEGDVS